MTTTPERAGREGETQPLPTASTSPHMHDLVRDDLMEASNHPIVAKIGEDLEARKAIGIKRYGQPLQAWNGRNPVLDAYEEALDLLAYTRQALHERQVTPPGDGSYSTLVDAYESAIVVAIALKQVLDA